MLLIVVAYKDSRKHDEQSFIIANRKVGMIPLISSMAASSRNASGVALWVGTGFASGYSHLSLIFGIMIGSIILGIVAPIMRKHSKEHITAGEMLKVRLGNRTALTVSIFTLIIMILYTSAQFFVLGNTIAAILGVSALSAMIVTALVVGLYLYMGGFSTVIKTDIIQFIVIIVFIVVIFFIPLDMKDVLAVETVFTDNWITFAMFCWGLLGSFCLMDFYQKIFAAKNDKVLRRCVPLVGPFLLIMTLSLIFLGMSAKHLLPAGTITDNVVFEILKVQAFPAWITVLLSLGIIAMVMSTIDTYSYVFSSALLEDFKKVDIEKEKKKYIKYSRIAMISLLVISIIIALNIEHFIQYIFGIGSLWAVVGPLLLVTGIGLLPKSKKMDIMITISLGISAIVFIVLAIFTQYKFLPLTLIPTAVNIILIGISWFVCRKKNNNIIII